MIFDYTPNRVEESPEAFQVFVKIIKSCASRWFSLSLEIPASTTYSLEYHKVFHGISFPELEDLVLRFDPDDLVTGFAQNPVTIVEDAPFLHQLTLIPTKPYRRHSLGCS